MKRFLYVLALVFGLPTSAQVYDIDIDDIEHRPCVEYASWIVKLRRTKQLMNLEPDEVAQIYSIKSYLWGAHLAFPDELYSDFEGRFIQACFDRPIFPVTQIVAFFMLLEAEPDPN